MKSIWTLGEPICEIMRTECDKGLENPDFFRGPYPSGAPAIFIDTAAKLGHPAGLIGAVGHDAFGDCIRKRLLRDGADCTHLQTSQTLSTGVAFVSYAGDGERTFIFHIGNAAAGAVQLPEELPADVGVFHVMGCAMMASETMREAILRAVPHYAKEGALISLDPNIRPEALRDRSLQEILNPVMEHCSVLLPGVEELLALAEESTVDAAAQKLFKRDILKMIILKDGGRGSRVITRTESFQVPVCKVDFLDSTGAGDSFDAGFLSSLLDGKSLKDCVEIASATAALNCAAFGPMEGAISPDAVSALILQNYR